MAESTNVRMDEQLGSDKADDSTVSVLNLKQFLEFEKCRKVVAYLWNVG